MYYYVTKKSIIIITLSLNLFLIALKKHLYHGPRLSIWYSKQKYVRLNFSTFSDSKVAKNLENICQKFGEWGLFEKMSNLSHFRRQIESFLVKIKLDLKGAKMTKTAF